MQFTSHKRRRNPSVIIVSLIDVLLVVMIFLMVTTTFKKPQPALKLALPESRQAQPGAADTKPLVITIATNAPYFYLSETPVTIERLQKELLAAVKLDPQVKVAIRADKKSPFGEVVKVIDAAKVAQVGSISAFTDKAGKP